MKKVKAWKYIANIVNDNYTHTFTVTYKDNSTRVFGLADFPIEYINKPYKKHTTSDPGIEILLPDVA